MLFKYIKSELERLNAGVWLGLAAVVASLLVPMSANAAGQITSRSVLVSSSAGAATTVQYKATFTLATSAQTFAALKVEICDSPLSTSTCVNTGNSSGATFTPATTATLTGGTGTWALGTHSGNSALITNSGSLVQTGTPTITATINGVTNPTAPNVSYYVRLSTYTNTGATTPAYPGTDFGAVALSTTNAINIAANVQESLTFCTGTSGGGSSNCSTMSGTSVNIGTGADNVLSSSNGTGGTSLMYITTNAGSGYVITYVPTSSASGNFASGANTITSAANQTLAACTTAGASCFGINAAANTVTSTPAGAIGSAPTGGVAPTVATGYNTGDTFKFLGAGDTLATEGTGGTSQTAITVSYVAQAGTTTKPGAYSTSMNYIATGTF